MARLTEEMVIARSKQSDLASIKKLNCWGAELGDVSLLRRMPNVEVLAFSINKIRSLGDFAGCRRLRELYVRKNEIRSLAEIRHLRRLPALTALWLDENPCSDHPQYRLTVLRNLPNLEKLDNVPVEPDEVLEAMRRGEHIPDSDDEGYPHQESLGSGARARVRSCDSSPERTPLPPPPPHGARASHEGSDSSEAGGGGGDGAAPATARTEPQWVGSPGGSGSPGGDERYTHPAMTRSVCDPRPAAAPLRHSLSAHSVKEYVYTSNGECRAAGGGGGGGVASPQHYHDTYYERPDRAESYSGRGEWEQERCSAGGAREWEQERSSAGGARERDREYPSAVMAEHRGFTRRPVARNSNLLSAVLCLVKELDYPALEVAEMAVRCRMDELANGQ